MTVKTGVYRRGYVQYAMEAENQPTTGFV